MDVIRYFQDMWQLATQGETQGVWFGVALYAIVVGVYSLTLQLRTRYWPFTRGELVDFSVGQFGVTDRVQSNQNYVSKTLYTYDVSGVAYEGSRLSPWILLVSHNARFILEKQIASVQRFPDGTVKVFYNPRNPKKSYLIVAGKVGICATVLICTLPLVSFYFRYL